MSNILTPGNELLNQILDNDTIYGLGENKILNQTLGSALKIAQEYLKQFALTQNFLNRMRLVFGNSFDVATASHLAKDWAEEDFSSAIPSIQVVSSATLNGVYGGYTAATNTIYLSSEFLNHNEDNLEPIVSVLLEEIGHFVDWQLNEVDSPGDEGEIFAALVQGKTLTETKLQELRQEDDTATITVDGQTVAIEQASTATSNAFYKYDIIAKTGDQGIQKIENRVSINDLGKVAFVGDLGTNVFGSNAVFVSNGISLTNIVPVVSGREYSTGVQINNSDKVVASWRRSSSLGDIALWEGDSTNSFQLIAEAGGFQTGFSYPFDYYSILPIASVNNNGESVFVAFEQEFEFDIFSGPRFELGDRLLVTASTPPSPSFDERLLPGSAAVFPVIADNGSVLISASQVVNGVSIRAINLYNNQLSTAETIAITSANGFTQLGNSPGISDDGNIVTFYGELNSGGASALNTNPGKGIFAAINTTSGWKIQRIAGIAGNGYLDPGETFQDTNNNGKFDTGEVDIGAFSDFDPNARVAVNSTQDTQRAVTIAYIANDIPININGINVSQKGLYTNRLNFFGSGAASFNAMDSGNEYTVNNPTLVTEVGDTIPELGTEPVKDLNIYDPLNSRDRGDVAFWVKTSTSEAVVRARSQAVVFLDFEPQKLPLPTEVEQIFNSYEIQPTWSGNTQLVFNTFGRPDITLSDIRDKIVKRVQDVFDAVGANVKVLGRSTDTLPTDGPITRAFIGDSPFGNINPSPALGVTQADPFNRDELLVNDKFYVANPDSVLVFVDEIFRPGSATISPKSISNATADEIALAIANVTAHEIGHSFGLAHINDPKLLMNGVPVTGELLNPQTFSNTNVNVLPDEVPKGQTAVQNDAERLAFAVGSNIEPSSLPRTAPPAETLEKLGRLAFKLGISLIPSSISVTQATIGIVREHEGSSAFFPEFIDLGSGNLATLLNREIQVPNGSKLILIASTDGNGIDIFGVSDGFSGNVGDIDLSNALLVMLDERLQGNLFDSSGQPLTSSLDLFHITPTGNFVQIGTVGSANATTNNPPQPVNDTATTNEDSPAIINVLANDSDADGDLLSFTLATAPSNGTATINDNGTPSNPSDDFITYIPNANFNGTDTFTYTLSDDKGTANATVALTVIPVNDAPVLQNAIADQNATEDTLFSLTVPANAFSDIDAGDTLTYTATYDNGNALPSWLTFNTATRTFSGMPGNSNVGNFDVKVTATDGSGASVSDTFKLTVTNVNDGPTLENTIANQTTSKNSPFTFTVPANNFSDIDAEDSLIYSAMLDDGNPLPNWLSFDTATGSFNGTPGNGDVGNINIKITATDSANASVSDIFKLTVTGANNAPTLEKAIADQKATITKAFSFTIPSDTFKDIDLGDSLTYSATLDNGNPLPSWLNFNAATRTFSGTPGSSDAGTLNLTVNATDSQGLSISDSFQLDILKLISGSSGNDTLPGTDDNDYILGREGRDVLTGKAGNDILGGDSGGDLLTGGLGKDQFVYTSFRDIGDTIKDFTIGDDKIVFTELLGSLSYGGSDPISDRYVRWVQGTTGTSIQIDPDGASGSGIFRPFILLENVSANNLSADDFVF